MYIEDPNISASIETQTKHNTVNITQEHIKTQENCNVKYAK